MNSITLSIAFVLSEAIFLLVLLNKHVKENKGGTIQLTFEEEN